VLTKCDKIMDKEGLDKMLEMDPEDFLSDKAGFLGERFFTLNKKIVEVINEYSMVKYLPLDI